MTSDRSQSPRVNNHQLLAKRIIECLGVGRKTRLVLINGWRHSLELADAIGTQLALRGIDVLNVTVSEETFFTQIAKLSTMSARGMWTHRAELIDVVDAAIYFTGPKDPSKYNKPGMGGVIKLFHNEASLYSAHKRLNKPGL